MVKGLGHTPDLERGGPETTVVMANSVKPSMAAGPCLVLSHKGHPPAVSREMGLFLEARVPWERVHWAAGRKSSHLSPSAAHGMSCPHPCNFSLGTGQGYTLVTLNLGLQFPQLGTATVAGIHKVDILPRARHPAG